jgi:plastocyanin
MHQALRSPGRQLWLSAALLTVALVTATAACGDDDDDASSSDTTTTESDTTTTTASDGTTTTASDGTGGADATLDVTELKFNDVSAPAGGTLDVVNSSGTEHTFTADDGAFNQDLPDGQTITVDVPTEAGDYPYHCDIHPFMKATLTAQ